MSGHQQSREPEKPKQTEDKQIETIEQNRKLSVGVGHGDEVYTEEKCLENM